METLYALLTKNRWIALAEASKKELGFLSNLMSSKAMDQTFDLPVICDIIMFMYHSDEVTFHA